MALTVITKQQAVEKIDDILNELQWTDVDQMVRDLERLKAQLEDNDPDWQETWGDTVGGCDPWGIGGLEQATDLFNSLGRVVVAEEHTV